MWLQEVLIPAFTYATIWPGSTSQYFSHDPGPATSGLAPAFHLHFHLHLHRSALHAPSTQPFSWPVFGGSTESPRDAELPEESRLTLSTPASLAGVGT